MSITTIICEDCGEYVSAVYEVETIVLTASGRIVIDDVELGICPSCGSKRLSFSFITEHGVTAHRERSENSERVSTGLV